MMPNTRALALRDSGGIALVALVLSLTFLFILWVELGRSLARRDVMVAICCGVLATSITFMFRRFKPLIRFPERRVPAFFVRLALYACAFVLIYAIPVADARFLHPSLVPRHGWIWALGFGLWMGIWFAVIWTVKSPKIPMKTQ